MTRRPRRANGFTVKATLAREPAEYVELEVSLAKDRPRRARLSEQILAASGALFEDDEAVREVEAYLERAVADAELALQAAQVVKLDG